MIFFCFIVIAITSIKAQEKNGTRPKYSIGFSNEVFLDVNQRDAKAALKILSSKFIDESGLNYEPEVNIFNDLKTLHGEVIEDKLDLVFMVTPEYLKIKDEVQIYPFTVPLIQEGVYSKFILLIKKNNGINSLADLRNKKIIVQSNFNKENSLVFMWLDLILMKELGEKHNTFFSDVEIIQKGSKVVLPVFFNNTDACIVFDYTYNTLIELNPQIERQLDTLKMSPQYMYSLACITTSPKNNEYDAMLNAMLNIHKGTDGKQFLRIFKVDQEVKYKPEYLESVISLLEEHKMLSANKSKKIGQKNF